MLQKGMKNMLNLTEALLILMINRADFVEKECLGKDIFFLMLMGLFF